MKSLINLNTFIKNNTKKLNSLSVLILRIGISFSMIYLHRYPRLKNFSVIRDTFADPLGIGSPTSLALVVFAEFFCSIFIIIGLLTRWSCVPLIITMCVATWIINGGKEFIYQEKSIIYLVSYISLFVSGAGYYSLDYLLSRKNTTTK